VGTGAAKWARDLQKRGQVEQETHAMPSTREEDAEDLVHAMCEWTSAACSVPDERARKKAFAVRERVKEACFKLIHATYDLCSYVAWRDEELGTSIGSGLQARVDAGEVVAVAKELSNESVRLASAETLWFALQTRDRVMDTLAELRACQSEARRVVEREETRERVEKETAKRQRDEELLAGLAARVLFDATAEAVSEGAPAVPGTCRNEASRWRKYVKDVVKGHTTPSATDVALENGGDGCCTADALDRLSGGCDAGALAAIGEGGRRRKQKKP
jgi:hypothetical protein